MPLLSLTWLRSCTRYRVVADPPYRARAIPLTSWEPRLNTIWHLLNTNGDRRRILTIAPVQISFIATIPDSTTLSDVNPTTSPTIRAKGLNWLSALTQYMYLQPPHGNLWHCDAKLVEVTPLFRDWATKKSASAFPCFFYRLCWSTNVVLWHLFIHLASCFCGSLKFSNQARREWSVRTLNALPQWLWVNLAVSSNYFLVVSIDVVLLFKPNCWTI